MADEFQLDLGKYVIKPEGLSAPEMMILYGLAGSGKTHLAASVCEVPGFDKVLIIDTENSTQGTIDNFPKEKIDVIRPTKAFPGEEYKGTKAVLEGLLTKTHPYKAVIIDVADVLFEWALEVGNKPGDGFAKWSFAHEELTAPRGLFHRLKAADFLVILVIHEKRESSEDGGVSFSDFQWAGQGKAKLAGIPDMVGYVSRDTNSAGVSTSTLQTAPTKRSNAKNRFNLPAKVTEPSMKKIYELIAATNKKENN